MATGEKTELLLNGESIPAQEFAINRAFFKAPESFTVETSGNAVDLMRRYPPSTPFALSIGGVVHFTGRTR